MNSILIIGGTDAPGFELVFVNGKWVVRPHPGWGIDNMRELSHAINVISEATRLKTPGVTEAILHSAMDLVQKELANHVKEGTIVVLR